MCCNFLFSFFLSLFSFFLFLSFFSKILLILHTSPRQRADSAHTDPRFSTTSLSLPLPVFSPSVPLHLKEQCHHLLPLNEVDP